MRQHCRAIAAMMQCRYFVPRWRFCGDTFEDTLPLREGASQTASSFVCSESAPPDPHENLPHTWCYCG